MSGLTILAGKGSKSPNIVIHVIIINAKHKALMTDVQSPIIDLTVKATVRIHLFD